MEKTVRFRARLSDGIANIKLMIFHEMETGYRKDKNSGEIIPQHFIHTVHVAKNNERVLVRDVDDSSPVCFKPQY